MQTKTLLISAIMLVLPFGVWADQVGPSGGEEIEDVVVADDVPYYLSADIDDVDANHIASTAYVKGAYNDTIAAINKVAHVTQQRLYSGLSTDFVEPDVLTADEMLLELFTNPNARTNLNDSHLATAAAVASAIDAKSLFSADTGQKMSREVFDATTFLGYMSGDDVTDDSPEETLVSMAAVATGIQSQRVEVWTTWDNDNAKTEVAFVTASAQ